MWTDNFGCLIAISFSFVFTSFPLICSPHSFQSNLSEIQMPSLYLKLFLGFPLLMGSSLTSLMQLLRPFVIWPLLTPQSSANRAVVRVLVSLRFGPEIQPSSCQTVYLSKNSMITLNLICFLCKMGEKILPPFWFVVRLELINVKCLAYNRHFFFVSMNCISYLLTCAALPQGIVNSLKHCVTSCPFTFEYVYSYLISLESSHSLRPIWTRLLL